MSGFIEIPKYRWGYDKYKDDIRIIPKSMERDYFGNVRIEVEFIQMRCDISEQQYLSGCVDMFLTAKEKCETAELIISTSDGYLRVMMSASITGGC